VELSKRFRSTFKDGESELATVASEQNSLDFIVYAVLSSFAYNMIITWGIESTQMKDFLIRMSQRNSIDKHHMDLLMADYEAFCSLEKPKSAITVPVATTKGQTHKRAASGNQIAVVKGELQRVTSENQNNMKKNSTLRNLFSRNSDTGTKGELAKASSFRNPKK